MRYIWYYETPIGKLGIAQEDEAISHILFDGDMRLDDYEKKETKIIQKTANQLNSYFHGELKEFDIPLLLNGTPFQKQVWQALMEIPYGQTCSYKDVAEKIGNPKAVRAVGLANNKNKIPIIIPCHRVIGTNGKLVGYAGGLKVKQQLIELEIAGAPVMTKLGHNDKTKP